MPPRGGRGGAPAWSRARSFIGGEDCEAVRAGVRRLLRRARRLRRRQRHRRPDRWRCGPLGVGPGDEVVTRGQHLHRHRRGDPAQRRPAGVRGRRPAHLHADPDPARGGDQPRTRTKVILPVHLYGHPADMQAILEIAERPRPARARGRGPGPRRDAATAAARAASGHAACFSFYPGKNLGAYGDGGPGRLGRRRASWPACASSPTTAAARTSTTTWCSGTNSRLDTLQAAVLRVKLRHLDAWNEERRRARARLRRRPWRGCPGLALPRERRGRALGLAPLHDPRAGPRRRCRRTLREGASRPPSTTRSRIHLQPALAAAAGRRATCRSPSSSAREVLSLPLYPELPLDDVARIASEVRAFAMAERSDDRGRMGPGSARLGAAPRRDRLRSCASAALRTSRCSSPPSASGDSRRPRRGSSPAPGSGRCGGRPGAPSGARRRAASWRLPGG